MHCEGHHLTYTHSSVKLSWNIGLVALLAIFPLLGAGCSGINTTQSVSPASFLIPGLMQADPPPADPVPVLPPAGPVRQMAQAR
jgi:hypothetical protein